MTSRRSSSGNWLGDVQEQSQRPPPLSQEVLEEALAQERAEQRQRAKERRRRHLPPVELEKQQVILEPRGQALPAPAVSPGPRSVRKSPPSMTTFRPN